MCMEESIVSTDSQFQSLPLPPCIHTADQVAMHEWMTVIDAAIQGVPEQAKRRLRTVTSHFSVRKPNQRAKVGKTLSSAGASSDSLSGLDLDLMESVAVRETRGATPLGSVETE